MSRKLEGDTLGEEIFKNMKKTLNDNTFSVIDDAFYMEQIENGLKFQVRRMDLLREMPKKGLKFGRYYDIPDEIELREAQMALVEEKEMKRDRTFEEFLDMFKDHIEGKVDANERVGNRPSTAEAQEAAAADRTNIQNESINESRKYQTYGSQGRASAASESKHSSQRLTGSKMSDATRDIPKNCKLSMPEK